MVLYCSIKAFIGFVLFFDLLLLALLNFTFGGSFFDFCLGFWKANPSLWMTSFNRT